MASAPGGLAHRCRDPPDQTALLERARDEIRKGTVQLSLRGYSHVFLHSADAGQPDTQSMRAPVEISTPAIAFQEVFDRTALRRIAEAYVLERDPTEVRESIDGDKPWEVRRPRARSTGHLTDMIGKLVVETASATGSSVPPTSEVATTVPAAEFAAPAASAPVSPVEVTKVSIATPAIADVASPQTAAAYGPALMRLIGSHAGSASITADDREAWAQDVTAGSRRP